MDQRDHRAFETAAILVAVLCLGACGADRESTPGDADTTAAKPAADTPALPRTPSPDGARVYFITPADGDTVTNPVSIEFGLDGMAVVPAGVDEPNSGHHHLIIDAGMPDLSLPIPANDNYVHFGDGSTKTERTLSPGTHTLQLLLGDHLHIPHEPPVASGVITVTVE